jgi:transcriptional regulator with XRE-family HTH domain
VNTKQRPPILRRRLGHRLRALREAAKLTIEDAAARLDKSRSALHRIEAGQTRADVHLIRSMMDIYDVYVDDLVDAAREAYKPQFDYGLLGYVDAEAQAVLVREFCALNLPGLLQTEPYIRALFARYPLARTPKLLEHDVAVRLNRQRRLTDQDWPLELVAIVDEAALRRKVGGTEVMRGQLEHVVKAATLPTVTLQVLPLRSGAHGCMDGGFNLLSFPEDDPELLYVAYVTGSLHIEVAEEVRVARLAFEQLRAEALDPADSVALIERVRAELDDA